MLLKLKKKKNKNKKSSELSELFFVFEQAVCFEQNLFTGSKTH